MLALGYDNELPSAKFHLALVDSQAGFHTWYLPFLTSAYIPLLSLAHRSYPGNANLNSY